MDYKEKYEQALEVAKETYNKQPMYKDWLESIFPELKESEDERIRKAIHIYLDWLDGRNKDYQPKGDYSIKDMIAWLEKQGEPIEINPTEFDTRLQNLIGKFDNLPKEELIRSLSFWMNVVQNDGTYKSDEKQGEQKHAWNEEDDLVVEDIKQTITNYWHGYTPDILLDWLESLKQRIGG